MRNTIYPYSIFYFTKSVYDGIGKNQDIVAKLFLKSILINIRYKDKIGTHITFTTKDIIDDVRKEEYITKFKGLMQLGKNIAFPEDSDNQRGDQNFKLLQLAINRDGDVLGLIKIVVNSYETQQAVKKIIEEDKYPISVITCEQALEEIETIEKRLYEIFERGY